MRRTWMVALVALWPAAGWAQDAGCELQARAVLTGSLDAADRAWAALDGDALDASMETVRAQVPCLTEPVDLALAIRVHRAHARHAWTTYNPDLSTRGWLAVRDLSDPWTAADEADVPEDHPVRQLWKDRRAWTSTLDESPPGGWIVDGTLGEVVPMDRAFLLQALERDGTVAYSAWHVSPSDVPQSPWRIARVRRMRVRGSIVAGALALAGGAALGGAALTYNHMAKPTTDDDDMLALRNRAHVLTAAGLGGVGAGALTAGVLWGVRW